jgi:hypothetical protein
VDDSTEFEIDPVTCLVGKNESGKTAILLALAALNPHHATPVELHRERDYPRRNLLRYPDVHGDNQAVVIRTVWDLQEAEQEAIKSELGECVLGSSTVEISRRYGMEVEISLDLNSKKAVQHFLQSFRLDATESAGLRNADTTTDLLEALNRRPSLTEKQQSLQSTLRTEGTARDRATRIVKDALPRFMYVSSYDRMDGAIQIERTRQMILSGEINRDESRGVKLFVEFLEYAGVPIADITEVPTYETFNAKLQAASTDITDQILEYWSQNPDLDVEVRIDNARPGDTPPLNEGTIGRARIKNNVHRVDTPFSERSAGFVWFFSFLVKFAQVGGTREPVILLLDEPGLSLHGSAQGDLLRFIDDRLAPSHQVIYSTHSPFMVPADKLERVRIVEDKVQEKDTRRISHGTKVGRDVLKVDADTLFPLQGALGYEVTQALFVGKHTLLVEGPSDILYLQAMSAALSARKRVGLDERWTLCPSGGIDRIMPFISLFRGSKLHVAVLSDMAHGSKGKVQRIRELEVLQKGRFFTIADFIDAGEGDVEDLFAPEVYANIVNRSYGLPEDHQITVQKLDNDISTTRIVKKVESLFNVMPPELPVFSHYTPADWLLRHPDVLSDDSEAVDQTLAVAEEIFGTFNALLG